VDVVSVGDVVVVGDGGGDAGAAVSAADQGEEGLEELLGEAAHDALWRHAEHLPLVRLRQFVALEPVLVAAHIWQYHHSFCTPFALIRFAIPFGVYEYSTQTVTSGASSNTVPLNPQD
jgi:hypothetical protein